MIGESSNSETPLLSKTTIVEGKLQSSMESTYWHPPDDEHSALRLQIGSTQLPACGVRAFTFFDDYSIMNGVPTFQLRPTGGSSNFTCFGISSDGSRLAAVSSENLLSLWDVMNRFTLMSTTPLGLRSRAANCLVVNPHNTRQILLSLNSGEAFQVDLRDAMQSVHTSEHDTRISALFKQESEVRNVYHVTKLSSDGSILIVVDNTGAPSAVQLVPNQVPLQLRLTGQPGYEGKPFVQIEGRNVLIVCQTRQGSAISDCKDTATVIWPDLNFNVVTDEQPGIPLKGEARWANGGDYVLNWRLQESRRYKLYLYVTKEFQSASMRDPKAIVERELGFLVGDLTAQVLDRRMFSFCCQEENLPLIAMHQRSSAGTRLVFWDTQSNELLHEIDLTFKKGVELVARTQMEYCFSSDCKWIGVCDVNSKMIGLVSVESDVFVWTAYLPQLEQKDAEFCSLCFDSCGSVLIVNLQIAILAFAPPCLSFSCQKQPEHISIDLSLSSESDDLRKLLRWTKEWPKQVLFNLISTERGIMSRHLRYLLDVAISVESEVLVLICHTRVAQCCLILIDYSQSSTRDLLSLFYFCAFGENFYAKEELQGVKRIDEEHAQEGISVFFFHEKSSDSERNVLFSSQSGLEMAFPEFGSDQSLQWVKISEVECYSFRQSKDRTRITALADHQVLIIDLEQKTVLNALPYKVGLHGWFDQLLSMVQSFGYFHFDDFRYQKCPLNHRLFLQVRTRGLFDVSADGKMILIGWDNHNNKSVVLKPETTEEQLQTALEDAEGALTHCFMVTEDGRWVGVIDYHKLKSGDLVVSLINHEHNARRRLWLGSDNSLIKTNHDHHIIANLFLQLDNSGETLSVLELEEQGNGLGTKLKQLFVGTPYTNESCVPIHTHKSRFEHSIMSTNVQDSTSLHGTAFLNMEVLGVSNSQYIFLQEKQELMNKAFKEASHHRFEISCLYKSEDNSPQTLLEHAIYEKRIPLIRECLKLSQAELFSFRSSSEMFKKCFYHLLCHHNGLLYPILLANDLLVDVCKVHVPSVVFHKRKENAAASLGTSNTVIEWWQESDQELMTEHWESENQDQLNELKENESSSRIGAFVQFFRIQDVCKLGLNGIIRFLLMQEAPSWVYKTGLVRSVITWKWERIWKKRCTSELLGYALFLLVYTIYAICVGLRGTKLEHNTVDRVTLSTLLIIAMLFAVTMVWQEYLQLKTFVRDGNKHFKSWMWGYQYYFLQSQWNLLELLSYALLLLVLPILHFGFMIDGRFQAYFFACVAVESILMWFKVWYYAQPFEQTGALVLLVDSVISDCLPFLFLAFVILMGYSIALFVLFQFYLEDHPNASEEPEGELGRLMFEQYGTPWRSVSTLFYAMVGTFDAQVYYTDGSLSWLTTLIFVTYMAIEMVVLLNMLIAVMGDTFDRVKSEEEEQILMGRARFMDACEATLTDREIEQIEKTIGKYLYVLVPSTTDSQTIQSRWQGRINVIDENVNKAIKKSEANVRELIREFAEFSKAQHQQDSSNVLKKFEEYHQDNRNLMDRIETLEIEVKQLSTLMRQIWETQQE